MIHIMINSTTISNYDAYPLGYQFTFIFFTRFVLGFYGSSDLRVKESSIRG